MSEPIVGDLYVYIPNRGAPIFFAIAYAGSAIGHVIQCQYYHSWKLIGLHPFCATLFAAGYALRAYGAFDHYLYLNDSYTGNLITFILGQVFVYVCPPLLELANYHVLGRILYYVPHLAPLPPGRVLTIFGLVMMVTETVNALGVALSSNPSSSLSTQTLGENLMRAALALQVAVIIIFVMIAGLFQWRMHKRKLKPQAIMTPLYVLYGSMLLIFIRCIFRLVEHAGNTKIDIDSADSLKALNPLVRHEWFFYVFEAGLMLLNSLLWNIWSPGRFLPRDYHVHLARDGYTEICDDEDRDDRPMWKKVAHIFTFGLLFGRKNMNWESRGAQQHIRSGSQTELMPVEQRDK